MKMNIQYAPCAKCGAIERKRKMRPLYSAPSSSLPPCLLCYLCESCYCTFLDEYEISEKGMYPYIPRKEKTVEQAD